MKFSIDYSRIFFDKYPLDLEEKRKNAHYILNKILLETMGEDNFSIEADFVTIGENDFGKIMEFISSLEMLKEEFFILVKEDKTKPEIEKPKRDSIEEFVYKNYQYYYLTPMYLCDKLEFKRHEADSKMRKKHNMTLAAFIKKVRVEKACEMLDMGFNNEKAAELSGLGSVKTLRHAFKSILGKMPSEYKVRQLDIKLDE